ncbi:hypothetical protein MIMGU_mgv1a018873mg [Erythranthe guttata]|uniref:Uncharacterized protein n=1 Tax=Erythranthe guttata TaxID=4155 RepID=A0A022RJD8_ERYGU|nr:hypothetical protein MIMGU_mgv1a018873mg [Erythranthe guttata]
MDLEKTRLKIKTENLETAGLTRVDNFSDSSVRIKTEEVYAKVCVEKQTRVINEKNVKISELHKKLKETNKEVEELKRQKLEADQIIEGLRAKNREACVTIEQLSEQKMAAEEHVVRYVETVRKIGRKQTESDNLVTELRRQNLEASRTVEHLGRELLACEVHKKTCNKKLSEADCTVKELRKIVEELKRQNVVVDRDARVLKRKFEDLVPLAVGLGKLLNVKIDGIVNRTNEGGGEKNNNTGLARDDVIEIINCDDVAEAFFENFAKRANSDRTNKRKGKTDCSEEVSVTARKKRKSKIIKTNPRKTWMSGAHMLEAFDKDDELCMKAVCALYRKQVSATESTTRGLLHRFETMRGRDLAEYLIDGDSELRLKKSVSEVKREFPDAISKCRILAVDYYEKLFMLYCSGEDPFFGPK